MTAYRWVYDSHHLQTDCQEPGSAPEPYDRPNRVWATFTFYRGPGPQASQKQRVSHQTVHILFLANDRCLRDYDLVVAHC